MTLVVPLGAQPGSVQHGQRATTIHPSEGRMGEMKPVRSLGACALALLTIGALTATSASAAAPEFGRCIKGLAGTKYSDAGCTKASKTGKFGWTSTIAKNKFKAHQSPGTLATLETVGKTKITCTAESNSGAEYTGSKTVGKIVAKFTGCETSKLECNSAGEPKGHITTFALKGLLGKESAKGLETQLTPESGALLAKFECSAVKVEVKGCVGHPVATNQMLVSSTEKFAATKGEQKPDKFLGGPTDQCTLQSNSGKGFEEAGQTITAILENEEAIEANSVV